MRRLRFVRRLHAVQIISMGTFAMVVLAFYTAGLTSNLVVTNSLAEPSVSRPADEPG